MYLLFFWVISRLIFLFVFTYNPVTHSVTLSLNDALIFFFFGTQLSSQSKPALCLAQIPSLLPGLPLVLLFDRPSGVILLRYKQDYPFLFLTPSPLDGFPLHLELLCTPFPCKSLRGMKPAHCPTFTTSPSPTVLQSW